MLDFAVDRANFDRHIAALGKSRFAESDVKRAEAGRLHVPGFRNEDPHHRHGGLLRPRRERPCHCCAAEKRDEFAAPHSITSSAVVSIPKRRLPYRIKRSF
jgi:hypothetical protein